MKVFNPFFSIIVPCFNQAHFLDDCVGSVIRQGFTDWEMIIVNDGSTDSTLEKAEGYSSRDPRIKIINKENGGLSAARNTGIRSAQGNYLYFLDSDDFVLENCLTSVYRSIKEQSKENDFYLIHCGYDHYSSDGKTVLNRVIPEFRESLIPMILKNNIGPPISNFISKKVSEQIGFFDEGLKSVEDWDYWMRAAKAGARLITIQEPLVAYRYVSNSMSRNAFTMYEALKEVTFRANKKDWRIVTDTPINVERNLDLRPTLKRQILLCTGLSVTHGKVDDAVKLFQTESEAHQLNFDLLDYALMCSYLNFRYWNTRPELETVIKQYIPQFRVFFASIGLDVREQNKAISIVFESIYKKWNHIKYGKLLGVLINRIQFGRLG